MMRRRDFLKTSMVAAGLAGSPELLQPLKASESSPQKPIRPDLRVNRSGTGGEPFR